MKYKEIVIRIPVGIMEYIKNNDCLAVGYTNEVAKAIKNGIPLPKGHGDLKDADVMINKLSTHEASELFGSVTCAEIMDFINGEKPIIEADREACKAGRKE